MLVLTRKQNEKIRIGDNVTITVVRTKGKSVRLGIEAPEHLRVLRGEIVFDLNEGDDRGLPRNAAPPRGAESTKSASQVDLGAADQGLRHGAAWAAEHRRESPRYAGERSWQRDGAAAGPLKSMISARSER